MKNRNPALWGVVALALTGAIQARAWTCDETAPTREQTYTATVLVLVNENRARYGLPPLSRNSKLDQAAVDHSLDQAARQTMSHTGGDGSTAGQRINRTGYLWRTWGENVAVGYPTPEAVLSGWMNSPGHRANILNRNFTEIGIGFVSAPGTRWRTYWTQVFGRPR